LPTLDARLKPALDGLADLHAVVKKLSADVEELRRDEDQRIMEKAANLSRAQIRLVRRPTVANAVEKQTGEEGQETFAQQGAKIFR
jgi:hypothetical protein